MTRKSKTPHASLRYDGDVYILVPALSANPHMLRNGIHLQFGSLLVLLAISLFFSSKLPHS